MFRLITRYFGPVVENFGNFKPFAPVEVGKRFDGTYVSLEIISYNLSGLQKFSHSKIINKTYSNA